jgi:hypothetical protein
MMKVDILWRVASTFDKCQKYMATLQKDNKKEFYECV